MGDAIDLVKLQDYFTDKFTKSRCTTEYIKQSEHDVNNKYNELRTSNKYSDFIVSRSKICRYIKQLKSGSAPGSDGITSDHIRSYKASYG